ncbi:MAG: ribonuclease H family protein [Dysgonamonadaceae bacterium]|jgi:ribonuclease HI|nr:ribonuclease H family protein [Dysgonamonadaceae bacterium]
MLRKKYYVVWRGVETGIYDSWDEGKKQVDGFEGALYKSFATKEEAVEAFRSDPSGYFRKSKKAASVSGQIIKESLSVDAACSGNPGRMEYRGVDTATGKVIFQVGPFEQGTNNIGEFLAIVHGLALLKKRQLSMPVYTDSKNGMLWVKQKKCKTKLQPVEENRPVFDLIRRAEIWLKNNSYSNPVLKWDTKNWGEIPADFGRK